LAGDDVVVRSWRVDKHLQERVRSFLDRYGDGDHYVVTPPATTAPEVHAIVNPAVDDGVTMAGTFRVVRNFEDPQFPGMVFQELRRGWLTALVAAARAHVPALDTAPVIDRWAGIRPRATSRAPLLGHHPARPGAFIANGGFKIGFGIAPMVGEVMADLILEGRDRIPAGMTG
jgi:glycine/D-amino acid oxidase-like deaminating enzyme